MRNASVGKTAIAAILLECERPSGGLVESIDPNDDWYAYLVERLFDERWADFAPSWLSIITFNYDRSLEQLLLTSAVATYGVPIPDAMSRLGKRKIVHVYGAIGTVGAEAGGHLAYGSVAQRTDEYDMRPVRMVREAAEATRVIPEGRDDDESLKPVHEALRQADTICFLSFDQTNVRRLGAPNVFLDGSSKPKHIAATTLGMTRAEARWAYGELFSGTKFSNQTPPEHSLDCPCERLLRETLVLS